MEQQKFELDLRMSTDGIVCNAEGLKKLLPEKLKPYKYIVTENNYETAKEDRTKLNNLYNVFQAKRKQFEEIEIGDWKSQKAIIMDMEKMIKSVADALGEGMKDIDEKEKLAKMEEVRESYDIVAKSMPLDIPFENFYIRKNYDAKKWTVKKILEDIQIKIDDVISKWKLLEAYLPSDPADLEQVKMVYIKTLDSGIAKAKADELKALRAKVSEEQKQPSEQPQMSATVSTTVAEPTPTENTDKKQRVVAQFIAVRAFYDEMNMLVKKYGVSVKVIEREEL